MYFYTVLAEGSGRCLSSHHGDSSQKVGILVFFLNHLPLFSLPVVYRDDDLRAVDFDAYNVWKP